MEFGDGVVKAAWDRQGGRCAKCGRWLIWAQRGRESATGAWQPHHRNPEDQEKRNALTNCIILCSGMTDCHFNEGHGGVNWSHYASLDDSMLVFLHAGEEAAEKTVKAPTAQKESLIGAFFGLSQAPASRKRGSRKQSPQGRARTKGKKEAADELGVACDL
ncbi:MAG: hypothetical protein JW753_09325 [Dehalococcoidia bacterium]|nr:hypothetical protein [Dehalococcoidia bacterium]